MSLEDDLRVVLSDRAAEPAPQPDLLESVRTGVRRDGRRRALLAGAAAALALVVAAAAPAVLSGRERRAAPAPAAGLVPPPWSVPGFPMRPSWAPGDLGSPEVVVLGPNTVLKYERDVEVLQAETGPIAPDWEVETTEEHAVDVGGRPATVRTADDYDGARPGDRFVGVRWRAAGGDWAQVVSLGTRTEDDVLRFARGLGPGTVAGRASVVAGLVPPGMVLQHHSEGSLCMAPPADVAANRQPYGLCIGVGGEPFEFPPSAEKVTVGGRPATYLAEGARLEVDLGGGRILDMSWDPEALPLTRQEAIRILEGVTIAN
ncbi:hypothetical protein AB0M02_39680 [Actinoplanes sp. NPDC051861]|uniref:hypothetical protein n=1 Tax=Actinoplanes sp. NPDC051861 TaxID=3155170 RepID=UPI0034209A6B